MKLKTTALYLILFILVFLTLAPFFWMLSASLSLDGEASTLPPKLLQLNPKTLQYEKLVSNLNLGRNFLNSLILSGLVTLISLTLNSMAGFAFAKYHFKWNSRLFGLLLSSLVIPAQITMLPLFLMLREVGLINTYGAIIIPGLANIFGIFLIRQYVYSVPDSLLEAARIDGAGEFQIYRLVVLPLIRPILVTLALFTFLGTWNDFLWPLIALTDNSMYTLPVMLANMIGEHTPHPELMMAGSVITILPVLVLFIFLQRYYVAGIMLGSVKE